MLMKYLIIGLTLLVGCARSADPLLGTWVSRHGWWVVFYDGGKVEIHRKTNEFLTMYRKVEGNRMELFRDARLVTPKGSKSLGEGTFRLKGDTLELSQGILMKNTLLFRKR